MVSADAVRWKASVDLGPAKDACCSARDFFTDLEGFKRETQGMELVDVVKEDGALRVTAYGTTQALVQLLKRLEQKMRGRGRPRAGRLTGLSQVKLRVLLLECIWLVSSRRVLEFPIHVKLMCYVWEGC
jgi:hypothetical protein